MEGAIVMRGPSTFGLPPKEPPGSILRRQARRSTPHHVTRSSCGEGDRIISVNSTTCVASMKVHIDTAGRASVVQLWRGGLCLPSNVLSVGSADAPAPSVWVSSEGLQHHRTSDFLLVLKHARARP